MQALTGLNTVGVLTQQFTLYTTAANTSHTDCAFFAFVDVFKIVQPENYWHFKIRKQAEAT